MQGHDNDQRYEEAIYLHGKQRLSLLGRHVAEDGPDLGLARSIVCGGDLLHNTM